MDDDGSEVKQQLQQPHKSRVLVAAAAATASSSAPPAADPYAEPQAASATPSSPAPEEPVKMRATLKARPLGPAQMSFPTPLGGLSFPTPWTPSMAPPPPPPPLTAPPTAPLPGGAPPQWLIDERRGRTSRGSSSHYEGAADRDGGGDGRSWESSVWRSDSSWAGTTYI